MKDRFGKEEKEETEIIQTKVRRAFHGDQKKAPQEVEVQIIIGNKVRKRSK